MDCCLSVEARADSPAREGSAAKRTVRDTGFPLFEGLDHSLAEDLALAFSRSFHPPGAIILRQGDQVGALSIIAGGIVEVVWVDASSAASDTGILLMNAGDVLMPAEAIFGAGSLVTARALSEVRLLELDSSLLRLALARSPQLAINLMRIISDQWRMTVLHALDLAEHSAAQRLGAFLLRIVDLNSDGARAFLPIRKRNLAVRLGMSAETLSRSLGIIRKQGLRVCGSAIIVDDRARIDSFLGA